MEVLKWLSFIAGVAGFVLTWVSVLTTLVIPRGGRSPISTILVKTLSRMFHFAAGLCSRYERADAVLAVQGPLSILVLLIAWLSLFVISFTLIAWPFAGSSLHHTLREVGSSFFTLGFTAPIHRTTLTIDLIAAATGPLIVALQIAYLPTLYSAFARREALVTLLDARAGSPPWGPELLARHNLVLSLDRTADLYSQWENWAADVAETHTNYRSLLFFRSPAPWRSWVTGLLAILDSAALYLALCPSSAPSEARMCLRMGFSCFEQLAASYDLPRETDPDPDTSALELTYEEFLVAVELLTKSEIQLERSPEDAWAHFRGWRVNYERAAYSIAELVTAPPSPWSGTRSSLRNVATEYPRRPQHRFPGGRTLTDRTPPPGS